MSNSTTTNPVPDYIDTLKNALFVIDDSLDFKVAHKDLSWTRLRGFTNTQGHYINASSNVCNSDADTTYGRFIHLDQERNRLRDDSAKWNIMANAVFNAFPWVSNEIDPSNIEEAVAPILMVGPNTFSNSPTIGRNYPRGWQIELFNPFGQLICTRFTSGKTIKLPDLLSSIYFYRVQSDEGRYIGPLFRE